MAATGAKGLLHLPNELLLTIFEELEDPCDVACLCISNKLLLAIGLRKLHRALAARSWAGDRVILLGDGTSMNDLPESILADGGSRLFGCIDARRPEGEDSDDDGGDSISDYSTRQDCLYDSACAQYTEVHYLLHEVNVPDYYARLERMWRNRRDEGLFKAVMETKYKDSAYEPKVLCNLSKRQYVREEPLQKLSKELSKNATPMDEDLLRVDLYKVLTIRTLWSTWGESGYTSPARYPNVHRGVWAGDRFEVMPVESFKLPNGRWPPQREWKDVTREVVREMRAIWKAEFGS